MDVLVWKPAEISEDLRELEDGQSRIRVTQ